VELQIGRKRGAARATIVSAEERAELWPRLVADWPRYQVYQESTARSIPLVELRWS
jgi:deazaflavin-dependent oxidoreductase (nitroreductase family)